ncbi:MAG TPA: division/cell wall cluster transcriptional repressor MraZ [Bacteroidales bacterium]|nr:division/cell wall cluster transcriptional repressor MraZ [Bacteroidales bacterium]
MLNLIGVHDCKLDAKGRVLFPAALKNQLLDVISEGFVIKRSIFQQCLELYPKPEWNFVSRDVNKLNRFVKKNNDFIRVFMAGVREVALDGTGRIQIPRDLVNFAGIKGDIVLASAVNIIEIWDKDLYEVAISNTIQDFSALAEEVMGSISPSE